MLVVVMNLRHQDWVKFEGLSEVARAVLSSRWGLL